MSFNAVGGSTMGAEQSQEEIFGTIETKWNEASKDMEENKKKADEHLENFVHLGKNLADQHNKYKWCREDHPVLHNVYCWNYKNHIKHLQEQRKTEKELYKSFSEKSAFSVKFT